MPQRKEKCLNFNIRRIVSKHENRKWRWNRVWQIGEIAFSRNSYSTKLKASFPIKKFERFSFDKSLSKHRCDGALEFADEFIRSEKVCCSIFKRNPYRYAILSVWVNY